MIPINSSLQSGCGDVPSSNCVKWAGPNILSLQIKTGDNITKVEYSIATKLCQVVNQLDMSTLDLTCLVAEIPDTSHTIKQVLQYILDNQCTLKSLIDGIDSTGGTGTVDISTVNLRCVKKFDEFENEIPQTIQQAIQSIVNQVCDNTTDIATLQSDLDSLQTQVDNLDLTPVVQIPNVSTCISTTKPVTTALQETTTEVCAIREILGATLDIQDALSKQCTGLKAKIGAPDGFIDVVNDMSASINNMWLAVCNILARVDYIEKTCCAPSCTALKIGFIVAFEDNQTASVSFTSGAGTFIPEGFEDCGSELTIINQDGVEFSPTDFVISQAGVVDGIDLSAFDSGDMLTFSIMARMCNDSLHCEKCVAKDVKYTPEDCCVITNTGTEEVTIVYSVPVNNGPLT